MLEFDGQEYCSFNALCRAYGLPDSTVRRRWKTLGWTLSEALGVTERETKSKYNAKRITITVEDPQKGRLEFDSIKTAAKYYQLAYDLVIQRLHKHGWTIEQAFGLTLPPRRRAHNGLVIEVDGQKFNSRGICANYFGVDQRLVFTRLKRGWSLKEALGIVQRSPPKALLQSQNAYVYQIQNMLTLKVYIGVTINSIHERFAQHVYSSTAKSKKGSLQAAMFKYGSERFEIELLETTQLQHLSGREKHWIAVKSSETPTGYNLNSGGAGIGRKHKSEIIHDGKSYQSISDIARAKGIKPATLSARLKTMTLEEALKKPFRKSPSSSVR